MAKKSEKTYNISVVGLSGTEKEKGSCGVGKSCLINRFMRPYADDYYTDHISVLSQSDFAGRVVNNDHFLYWGDVTKSEDGVDCNFHVIEQTEFVDDSSFQSFRIGKTDPYYKRCAMCKLQSAEKLAYISKDQLGLEHEFEQKFMPEGKFSVDGFLCVFDVSRVANRSIELQVEHTFYILSQLIKTKKPIVIATTKNDEVHKPFVTEIERLVQKKELKEKGTISVVETSAHENVNVDSAFFAVAHAVDKASSRLKNKISGYADAAKSVREHKENIRRSFMSLLRSHVANDYRALWIISQRHLQSYPEFVQFVQLFGTDKAGKTFKSYLKDIREEHLRKKETWYLKQLEISLREILPDLDVIGDRSWYAMLMWLQRQEFFSEYFVVPPPDLTWKDEPLVDSDDDRLPWDLVQTNEAELVYRNHLNVLRAERRRLEFKNQFLALLEENPHVTPGKPLTDVSIQFLGRECYSSLPERDRQEIYDEFQKSLKEKAKQDFQELLFENAELFARFERGSVQSEDIKEVSEKLQNEFRHKNMSRMDDDRKSMLLSHFGFIQHSSRESCPFRDSCAEIGISNLLSRIRPRDQSWMNVSLLDGCSEGERLHLAIISEHALALQLQQEIMDQSVGGLSIIDGEQVSIDLVVFPLNAGNIQTFSSYPQGFFCAYNSLSSLMCIERNLNQLLGSCSTPGVSIERLSFVVVLGHNVSINEDELTQLREQGQALANRLNCHFVDIPSSMMVGSSRFFYKDQVGLALHTMVTLLKHKATLGSSWQLSTNLKSELRILMCFMCGDPFKMSLPLSPLLNHQLCHVTHQDSQSLSLIAYLEERKHKVEVVCSSYHEASKLLSTLFHGWILAYSTHRIASLSNLKAFAAKARNVPTMIVAVSEANGVVTSLNQRSIIHMHLFSEGSMFANQTNSIFLMMAPNFEQQIGTYAPFFKVCLNRKSSTEQSFNANTNCSISEKMKNRPPAALPCRYAALDARSEASSSADESDPSSGNYRNGEGGFDTSMDLSNIYPDHSDDVYSEIASTDTVHLLQPFKFNETSKKSRSAASHSSEGKKRYTFSKLLKNKAPSSTKKTSTNPEAPLATPELVDIAEYAQPADFLERSGQNSLYASVVGALPHGKLQRIRVPASNEVSSSSESFSRNDPTYLNMAAIEAMNERTTNKKLVMKSRSFDGSINSKDDEDFCTTEESEEEVLVILGGPRKSKRKVFPFAPQEGQRSNVDLLSDDFDKSTKLDKEPEGGPWKWKNLIGLNNNNNTSKSSKSSKQPSTFGKSKKEKNPKGLEELCQSEENLIPLFVEKCLHYIELHGATCEGIYRVSGNKAHVNELLGKFEDDPSVDFMELNLPVNLVATALKTFLQDLPVPVIPQEFYGPIKAAVGYTNKADQLNMIRGILLNLPKVNYVVLKCITQHIERVSHHKSETSMDVRNLSICWWPTLMRPDVTTLDTLPLVSKPLEEFLFLLIDNSSFLFPPTAS